MGVCAIEQNEVRHRFTIQFLLTTLIRLVCQYDSTIVSDLIEGTVPIRFECCFRLCVSFYVVFETLSKIVF